MRLDAIRRLITLLIIGTSGLLLLLVWSDALALYGSVSTPESQTTLVTVIQTAGALGAAALAVVFITAQLSAAGGRPSILRELYRSSDIYILFTFLAITVLGGVAVLAFISRSAHHWEHEAYDSLLIFASGTVLLVLPTIMSQLENLDQTILASKLSSRLTPDSIIAYGLTDVRVHSTDHSRADYHLITVGLRPNSVDPLRPLHELLMEAVGARDRVLFGKLFRYMLEPIARVHGAYWDPHGVKATGARGLARRIRAARISEASRVHVSLAILHYAVKRARNLITEWEERDVGRHGILTGLSDLIRSLAPVNNAEPSLRICLFAVLNIARYYAPIRPYGRIEPMNAYFLAANELDAAGKQREAILCVEVLAWVSTHTRQVAEGRAVGVGNLLRPNLQEALIVAKRRARANPSWVPGNGVGNPWSDWPDVGDPWTETHMRQNSGQDAHRVALWGANLRKRLYLLLGRVLGRGRT